MQVSIKSILISLASFLVLDMIWFQFSLDSWKEWIKNLTGNEMSLNLIAAIFAYLLMGLGLNYLSYVQVQPDHWWQDSLKYGAIFGLVVYGIFDMTNLAILNNNYPIKLAIIDMIWGVFISALTLVITSYFTIKF